MKTVKRMVSAVFLSALVSLPVYAGTWHAGTGNTIKEATDAATKKAFDAVRRRGKGCVDKSRKPVKQGDKWVVQVHQSHHNGSCGK